MKGEPNEPISSNNSNDLDVAILLPDGQMLDGPIIDDFTCHDVAIGLLDLSLIEPDELIVDEMMERFCRDFEQE